MLVKVDVAILAVLIVVVLVPVLREALGSVAWVTMAAPVFVQVPAGLVAAAGLGWLNWVLLRGRTY